MNDIWNYILSEDTHSRTILRVYPNRTYIHSFNHISPKTWKEVYKVYYAWGIIKQYKDDDGVIIPESSEKLLDMWCDECSMVSNLHDIIRWVIENQEEFDYPTIGQPAGDWRIEVVNKNKNEYYKFQVFDNWNDNGFRFRLDRNKALDFANWLEKMNNRALTICGCPI